MRCLRRYAARASRCWFGAWCLLWNWNWCLVRDVGSKSERRVIDIRSKVGRWATVWRLICAWRSNADRPGTWRWFDEPRSTSDDGSTTINVWRSSASNVARLLTKFNDRRADETKRSWGRLCEACVHRSQCDEDDGVLSSCCTAVKGVRLCWCGRHRDLRCLTRNPYGPCAPWLASLQSNWLLGDIE